MKRLISLFTGLLIVFISAIAFAATSNPSPGSSGYMVLPLTFDRTITATATPIKFKLPYPATVVGVTASAATIDLASADETYTVDLKEGATSILSTAVNLAAPGTVYDGVVSDTSIADEATLSLVLTLGGTTPSLTDLSVLLVLKRL